MITDRKIDVEFFSGCPQRCIGPSCDDDPRVTLTPKLSGNRFPMPVAPPVIRTFTTPQLSHRNTSPAR